MVESYSSCGPRRLTTTAAAAVAVAAAAASVVITTTTAASAASTRSPRVVAFQPTWCAATTTTISCSHRHHPFHPPQVATTTARTPVWSSRRRRKRRRFSMSMSMSMSPLDSSQSPQQRQSESQQSSALRSSARNRSDNDDDDGDNCDRTNTKSSHSNVDTDEMLDVNNSNSNASDDSVDEEEELDFIRNELLHIESLENVLAELEEDYGEYIFDDDDDDNNHGEDIDAATNDDDELFLPIWDQQTLDELLGDIPYDNEDDEMETTRTKQRLTQPNVMIDSMEDDVANISNSNNSNTKNRVTSDPFVGLEQALLQGVVPVSAGVGSECLPGDFGFDPLRFSDYDLIQPIQSFLLDIVSPLPLQETTKNRNNDNNDPTGTSDTSRSTTTTSDASSQDDDDNNTAAMSTFRIHKNNILTSLQTRRPKALILRDYREAEIRHGRLAMLAAVIWPLQEMLDRFVLAPDQFGPLIYGPITLPYFPLLMTAILLLLGYLDIYSKAIKDMDQIGDAFLPGDCFWDPLQILQGASDRMKRNMQERELLNGRAAMIAVAVYTIEEAITHKALIDIEGNALLLEPAYQVPFIQQWLDEQFVDTTMSDPSSPMVLLLETITTTLSDPDSLTVGMSKLETSLMTMISMLHHV